jgi:hypothetical protein
MQNCWRGKRCEALLPVFDWLRRYDRNWLRGDVVAGITLAAYLLPAALGDASLANLRAIVASGGLGLDARGVKLLGELPVWWRQGLTCHPLQ